MRIGDLSQAGLERELTSGLCFANGPFFTRVTSDLDVFAQTFRRCYANLSVMPASQLAHFSVAVRRRPGPLARVRPQAEFLFEGVAPFQPYPQSHAFPMFEWGLNWCIANTAHQYLMLHAAAVERRGRVLLLPAPPGSGKSTLCAALVGRGWRLFSDEFGMLRLEDGLVQPLPRAAPLKNASIDVIRAFAPSLRLGLRYEKTRKGTVAHLFPPGESLERQTQASPAGAVVFPRYVADAGTRLVAQPPMIGIKRLSHNSFNYLVTGEAGFAVLCNLVRTAECYELTYSRLEEAVERLADLLDGHGVIDPAEHGDASEPRLDDPSVAERHPAIPA